MRKITVTTRSKKEVIDITDIVNREVNSVSQNKTMCHLFLLHTTAALTTADLDPGTDLDMLDAFEEIIPKLSYRHPHNPAHVSDHILSSLLGTSLALPLRNGEIILGTWQRVVLVEFNGPRERDIAMHFF